LAHAAADAKRGGGFRCLAEGGDEHALVPHSRDCANGCLCRPGEGYLKGSVLGSALHSS
jgi:hypothetical protein